MGKKYSNGEKHSKLFFRKILTGSVRRDLKRTALESPKPVLLQGLVPARRTEASAFPWVMTTGIERKVNLEWDHFLSQKGVESHKSNQSHQTHQKTTTWCGLTKGVSSGPSPYSIPGVFQSGQPKFSKMNLWTGRWGYWLGGCGDEQRSLRWWGNRDLQCVVYTLRRIRLIN